MRPIKVLHVLEVEKEAFYFNNLIDYTDPVEVQFSFVTFAPEDSFSRSIRDRGCVVYNLGPLTKKSLSRAGRNLWSILRKENPNIVHTHLFNPTLVGLNLAKLQCRKTVLTRHHSDALHQLPSVIKRNFYLRLEYLNNFLANHIIAPSRMVRDYLIDHEGTPSNKVSLIPYGQTYDRFSAVTSEIVGKKRAELGMNDQLSLVCVSRLFHRKGHVYLFRAIAPLIKNGLLAKLYLLGPGEYKIELLRMARELGIIDNIEFLGWRDDVLPIIASADIIVHPSLEDALSQSLIESLMLGRPIVATDISGASDILDGGKYGKLVRPADADDFQKALQETIGDIDTAKERASKGKAYLLEYMDARRVSGEYLKIYQRVLGR